LSQEENRRRELEYNKQQREARELKEKLEVCYGPTPSDGTSSRRHCRRRRGKRNLITGKQRKIGKSWRHVANPTLLTERRSDSSQMERKQKEIEVKGKETQALEEKLEVRRHPHRFRQVDILTPSQGDQDRDNGNASKNPLGGRI